MVHTDSRPLIAVLNPSPDLTHVLQLALADDGFHTVSLVSARTDGAAARLAFLRTHRPAVVIYGLSMPYRDSWQTLQEIRQQWSDGHFILTTMNPGAVRACIGSGDASELMVSPFDLDEIAQALERVLAVRPTAPAVAASEPQGATAAGYAAAVAARQRHGDLGVGATVLLAARESAIDWAAGADNHRDCVDQSSASFQRYVGSYLSTYSSNASTAVSGLRFSLDRPRVAAGPDPASGREWRCCPQAAAAPAIRAPQHRSPRVDPA